MEMQRNVMRVILLALLLTLCCSLLPAAAQFVPMNSQTAPQALVAEVPGKQDFATSSEAVNALRADLSWLLSLTADSTQDESQLRTALDYVASWNWSPNGFPPGQCTWYADGRILEARGKRLTFSQSYGRDAWKWWTIVTNVGHYPTPWAGNIMVLGQWNGNSAGHVAYVESVDGGNGGSRWTVTHANWGTTGGNVVRGISGYNIRQIKFEFVPGRRDYVRIVGRTTWYPLRGFIA